LDQPACFLRDLSNKKQLPPDYREAARYWPPYLGPWI
jgi:hypothetical protein